MTSTPSSSGWGKKAATRIDRTQFDNDELLKSLGSQFNVDFSNYDQWQRIVPDNKSTSNSKGNSVRGDGKHHIISQRPSESKRWLLKDKKSTTKFPEISSGDIERMKMLELKIDSCKKRHLENEKRCKELIKENRKLASAIHSNENSVHNDIKVLLRRYERYRGGISVLNTNFSKELQEALHDLDTLKTYIETNSNELDAVLQNLNDELEDKQSKLKLLVSYKDKEYPVKAIQIAGLETEINNLKMSNQEELEELKRIVNAELGKYEKTKTQTENEITMKVTEKAVVVMHQGLKDIALQNMVMKKEMEFHENQRDLLKQKKAELEKEIDCLKETSHISARFSMFPELFTKKEKCSPEMDIILDIPKKQSLEI